MFKVLDIAGMGMNAQMLRLNTTASNVANAEAVSGSEETAYRAKNPVFQTLVQDAAKGTAGVGVRAIVESDAPVHKRYEPGHPLADPEGYVYGSNVNPVEEMANMISASRSYQSNAEVFNTTKTLLQRTLQLGQQ